MLNNQIFSNFKLFQNKYFFVLCFYLKKNLINNNYIYNYLFLGYKYNYILLNINVFIKLLKKNLNLIKKISQKNGNILILYTQNKILNFILQKNCIKNNINYLSNLKQKQANLLTYLSVFPDLVISFDYKTNAIFLNKIKNYNVPVICITNSLNKNIINNFIYYLIINNNSIYSNLLIIYLFFNNITSTQKIIINNFN